MRNKKNLLFIFILFAYSLFADDFILAPILVCDEKSEQIEINYSPNKDIYEFLKEYNFDGLLTFKYFSEDDTGIISSIIDAQKLCQIENARYVLYGFIQKNAKSWYANLKLYDSTKKRIIKEVYSSDDRDHFDRLYDSIKNRVLDVCRTEIGLNEIEFLDRSGPFEFNGGISFFYWSPLTENWMKAIYGIVGSKIYFDFFPPMENTSFFFMDWRYSGRLEFEYSYGIGNKNNYPANYHTIAIKSPVFFHLFFNEKHNVFVGCGPYYEFELLQIQQKYMPVELLYQNMFGIELILGYSFKISNFLRLYTEVETNFHISDNFFVAIKPNLGVQFKIY